MQALTKAEEQVMNCLWKLKKAFLKDLVDAFPEPKPAYTTISTVLRVLVKKGFVGYETFSKVHQYHPLISKKVYFKGHFKNIATKFFNGSHASLASFFTEAEDITVEELETIKAAIEERINEQKGKA